MLRGIEPYDSDIKVRLHSRVQEMLAILKVSERTRQARISERCACAGLMQRMAGSVGGRAEKGLGEAE
jgi:hypothetical protein